MIKLNLLEYTDSHHVTEQKGCFSVVEYEKDISVSPENAEMAYFASQMNVRKRQVVAELHEGAGVIIQSGTMQMMAGNIRATTNVKGVGDLMKKAVGSVVTKETAIKPMYTGEGYLVLEPTYRYILLADLSDWENEMVIEDGLFLACDDTVDMKVTARTTLSSAVLGKEGMFNTTLIGEGFVAMESPVPPDELIELVIEDDEVRIDGPQAIAWSYGLHFTVERTMPTLVGSAFSREGLVNVFRGTGRVLMAPVDKNRGIAKPDVNP